MRFVNQTIRPPLTLDIAGLGFILYSPFATSHIRDGEDYLSTRFSTAQQVLPHVHSGTLTGFGTQSPGTYHLQFLRGYPAPERVSAYPLGLRLALEVRENTACVRDLYDLLDWLPTCPSEQLIPLSNGIYHVTVCSAVPPSGILGFDQEILLFFKPLETLPRLSYEGIPTLESLEGGA